MRFRFDHFAKKLLRKLLSGLGHVETEVEVAVDAQRIDLLFTPAPPDARRPAIAPPRRSAVAPSPQRAELGLLGRIVASHCLLEAFRTPPTFDEIRACIRKLLNWHHLQILRAKRRARPPRSRTGDGPRKRPPAPKGLALPQVPTLWILSSGHPAGAVEAFALHPIEGWPPGVYAFPQEEIPVRLVVISELPHTRETLVLRLLGRGATFTRAARDLGALPRDAPERRLVAPFLVSLHAKLVKVQAKDRLTEEEKELLVNGQKLIDAIENKGWKRGQKQGREAGLEPLVHQFTRRLGRPLTQGERTTIIRRLDTLGPSRLGDVVLDLDAASLATWLADPDAR